jgi:hypothetical protein
MLVIRFGLLTYFRSKNLVGMEVLINISSDLPHSGRISETTLGPIYQNHQVRVIKLISLAFRLRTIMKYLVC